MNTERIPRAICGTIIAQAESIKTTAREESAPELAHSELAPEDNHYETDYPKYLWIRSDRFRNLWGVVSH